MPMDHNDPKFRRIVGEENISQNPSGQVMLSVQGIERLARAIMRDEISGDKTKAAKLMAWAGTLSTGQN